MSDTGMGNFARISPSMADLMRKKTLSGKVFEVGETVQVKDSQFTVQDISKHTLMLRLIPDDKYQQIPKP